MKKDLTSKRGGLPVYAGPGVYAITNKRNGKAYVGSAFAVRGRLYNHRYQLRKGTHCNHYLQRAWDKHGEAAFRFDVIEACPTADVLAREQRWMDQTRSYERPHGYNIAREARNAMGGRRHTEASRRKMSTAQKGRDTSKATAASVLACKGKARPPEVRAKIGAGHRRRKNTKITRQRMKKAHWSKGPNAVEIAARISAAKTGVPQTADAVLKRTAGMRGRPKSMQMRRRLRAYFRRRRDEVNTRYTH